MTSRDKPDRPWLIRTYSGHSSAAASNALYRENLARGQTGLSVAFDLPTQTGYDADAPEALGEVGKVGVPIGALPDMETLFDGIPLSRMNTSMTINATAPWLLALYVAAAERQGADRRDLLGTTQNDLVKEFLSRGTYMLPPEASLRLQTDVIAFTVRELPKWNPVNVCSYHLQEAGATPVLEVSYALANALTLLDAVRAREDVDAALFPEVAGRISFFVNAGIRFVTEMVKLRVMGDLWDELLQDRYGVADPRLRRFRYGVQVNSLGLTEQQPENNVYRIALEMLGVVLSKRARARAVQLPAWNEALGLPRPWDQQWSLRLQQIMAFETDLLEHDDLFDGSSAVTALEEELAADVRREMAWIEAEGGVIAAVASGAMKERLVVANAERLARIERGEQKVVGVNCFEESAPSPLAGGDGGGADQILVVDAGAGAEQIARLEAHRVQRNKNDVAAALQALRDAAKSGASVMEPSIRAAHAGVTTGEWGAVMREVFGEYRAPTGLGAVVTTPDGSAPGGLEAARAAVRRASDALGRRLKLLVGKPGLDGHSNGAEQIAVRARDAGMEVVYEGIRLTPAQIALAAEEEGVHVVGLSILSGSHLELVPAVLAALRARDLADVPLVVGGIIPEADRPALLALGVARVFTPSDFDLNAIMTAIAEVAAASAAAA
ncbi:MAG: protein meaA [Deltaproteobacteria bacterium]|nr:protein meaA [Deltaproteobacteria bacterium]